MLLEVRMKESGKTMKNMDMEKQLKKVTGKMEDLSKMFHQHLL